MSQTFSLVCHETKKMIWIGQGWGKMEVMYTGHPDIMERLKAFLQDHEGKNLQLLCGDRHDEIADYEEYME